MDQPNLTKGYAYLSKSAPVALEPLISIRISQSESSRASPLARDPNNNASAPWGRTSCAILFIPLTTSVGVISSLFCNNTQLRENFQTRCRKNLPAGEGGRCGCHSERSEDKAEGPVGSTFGQAMHSEGKGCVSWNMLVICALWKVDCTARSNRISVRGLW